MVEKIIKKELAEEAIRAVKIFEKYDFYPRETSQAYIISLIRNEEKKEEIKNQKENLKRYNEIKDYISEIKDEKDVKIVEQLLNPYGYEIEYLKERIEKDIDYLEKELENNNNKDWDTLISVLSRKHFIEVKICYHLRGEFHFKDEFKWLKDKKFNVENIIKNKGKILKAIENHTKKEAMNEFIYHNKYGFLAENKKLSIIPYEVQGFDVYDYGAEYKEHRARKVLTKLYAIANKDCIKNTGVIEEALAKLQTLNEENKRLFINFVGCEIKFYKTQKTKVTFTKEILENIKKEIEKREKN